MKFPIFFSSTQIGLDIQPDGIRLLQVKKRRGDRLLERAVHQSFTTDVYVDGKIKHWANLCKELTHCVQAHDFTGKTVIISLPTNLVRMQHLNVPIGLHDKEIEAEIYEHLRRDLVGKTEALAIDFMQTKQPDATSTDIFFVATRQEYLSDYVNCVNKAGLNVKVVDVDIYALARALCYGLSLEPGINAIIFEHHGVVILIIFNHHEILFHQHWDRHESQDFLTQIKTRLRIFYATFCGMDIDRWLIFAPPDLIEVLQQNTFAYPLHVLNPFAQTTICFNGQTTTIREKLSDYFIAFGLALRVVPIW